ncbi:hypothetical protein CCHR01_10448 [Colletotrichum chrysophilum]|uniref:Uncharacterized protein n=1 Tax=Colletotrichum chrysophilum TaxID=1836956 RepID=A0AAD9EFY0_9PEZI|nr:hypothetical protein CCHR01_10448 [Colletotrichum chrysophilum]
MLLYTVNSVAWLLVVGNAALRNDHHSNVIRQVAANEAVTCQFLHQKELGLCGPSTGVPTHITTTVMLSEGGPNAGETGPPSTPVETTAAWDSSVVAQPALTTSTTVHDGVTKEVVIINGGPLTSPITLPASLPTKLDPSAPEVRSSVSSISSDVSIALSTVTAWITQPEQPRASEAIKAVQPLVSIVGGLTNNIPGGVIETTCTAMSSEESGLAQNLSFLMCRLLDILRGLGTGLVATDPSQIDSATIVVRSGSEEVAADISSAAANVGAGGAPLSTTPTGVPHTAATPTVSTPIHSSTGLETPLTTDTAPTLTKIPELAVFQTLTDVTYTTPTYITTTSPRSDQPTIVPVIIPFSGPPRICFGCYLSFPPNIAISVPEFCIQLFGLNIGSCPPSSDTDGKDGDNNEDQKSDSQSSTTSTSSSCTTTITATHESVFCSVTKESPTDGSPTKTLGCSTAAFTTVTGCSGQNSATTSTSELSTPTEWLCNPSTCGDAVCAASKKRSRELAPRELQERGDPEQGVWPDPSDYEGNQDAFMAGETWEIVQMQPPYDAKEVKLTTFKHGDHVTSHNWVSFDDKVAALSVHGLYGCTSVVVLSQRGAWASHIWEKAFTSHIENDFTLRAIRDLHSGVGSTNILTEYREWGMDDLKDKPDAGNRGIIFGDGTPADSNLPIQVFIFTPRERPTQSTPDEARLDPNYNAGGILYGPRIAQIHDDLYKTFSTTSTQVRVDVIDYAPKTRGTPQQLLDVEITESRGKLLIQYQPAPDCTGKASWRMWVEGRPLEGRTASWDPASNQIFQGQAAGGAAAKRQACPIRSATPGGTSSEPSRKTSLPASVPTTVPTTTRPMETLTSSPEPAKTTSSPAVKESTTAPPPPKSTTSNKPPPPKPTEQVLIEFALEKATPSEPGQVPNSRGSWVMFLKKADDASRKECDDKRIGLKAIDTVLPLLEDSGDTKTSDNLSWPPTFEADSGVEVSGRKQCRYNEKKDGAGTFVCDGIGSFDCIKDEQSNGPKTCGGLPQLVYYPKVRCLLPVA